MKKIIWLCLAVCLLLCACKKTDPPVTTDAVTTPDCTVKTTEQSTVTEPLETVYAVEKVSPALGEGVAVNYEVLTTEDADLDELLKKAAEAEFSRYIPNASSVADNGGSADYTVELTRFYADETLICATFEGSYSLYYADGAGSEESGDVFYTLLIDPVTKKMLSSADIVRDFAGLKAAFADGKFAAFGAAPYAENIAQYRTEYGIYPYVALDADYFYLYITESGMNEYTTEYSISRADANDFLNENFQIVEE